MLVGDTVKNLEMVFDMVRDPERFILNRYYRITVPKGFRVELFVARKITLFCNNLGQLRHACYEEEVDCGEKGMAVTIAKKIGEKIVGRCPLTRYTARKIVCPYCEKLVVPKRLHRLDLGDLALFLFTGGFWAILLLAMYIFIRRCPLCNYSLRGFRPLSEEEVDDYTL